MSNLKDSLEKSLNDVAIKVANESLGDSSLIKACEIYKWRINFTPDKTYNLIKAKTFNNFINNIPNKPELIKALIIGETKVVNGITYVVKQTKSGKLDWRVANKQSKSKKDDGNNKVNLDLLFDTQNFPDSVSELKFVSKLGGSTGAELYESSLGGDKYVLKKGASKGHIEEEFLMNCIYKLMGVKVPTVKRYEENINGKDEVYMLSKFIEDTTPVNNVIDEQYVDDMTNHYVLDCLLANWDIYKNDNILVDNNTDEIIRVDNGGGLRYSAQGRDKGDHFTDEVEEIEQMLINNPHLATGVTSKKIKEQIKAISKNKNKILSLIEDPDLKLKLSLRIASLEMRNQYSGESQDPYRELTDKELDKAMKACKGDLFATNDLEGWIFLSTIAKMRGFDGTPTVLKSEDFDDLLKDDETILINRGLSAFGGRTAKSLMREFTDSEHCFYGKQAMYGAGIYGAVNSFKKNDGNHDYQIAYDYASGQSEHILDVILPKDMNIIDGNKLDEMMADEFFGDEFKESKKAYDEAVENINKQKLEKEKIEKDIEEKVKTELGWNEKTLKILNNSKPEEVYSNTEKFKFDKILSYYKPILKSINGKLDKIDENNYEITLPNNSKFLLNKRSSEHKDAIKKKNEDSNSYNYQYKLLKDFIIKEHFHDIKKKVNEKINIENRTDTKLIAIKDSIKKSELEAKTLSDEINKLKTDGNSNMNSIMAQIAKRPGGEFRGFYAAIKGYDAIIQKNGWGGKTDFCIILNRSKTIVREFK